MTAVFEQILEMSLTAAVVIMVVMFIRLLLRKAPRKYSYALWSVAAFRLVCPVSFEAVFSLFTFTKQMELPEVTQIVTDPTPTVSPGYFDSVPPGYFDSVPAVSGSVSDYIDPDDFFTYPVTTPPAAETPTVTQINWLEVAAVIWLIGLAALVIYGIVSYVRLRRRMSTAVLYADNIWQSDRVQSPFILGFAKPRIYLPFGLTMEQHRYVLAHETCHLERLDHIVRPLSFLILALHWFNPLVWAAYYMMGRDMEMSCDEKVLSGGESVKAYSTTLLSFAANRRFPSPSPLAFGESGVKSRIKNALNWKKPRTWVTVIAVVLCVVVITVCAANPKEVESEAYKWTSSATVEKVEPGLYGLRGYAGHGELTDSEKEKLVELLRALPNSAFEKREGDPTDVEGTCQLSLYGGHYLSYQYPEDQLFIALLIGDGHGSIEELAEWEIESDELKEFMFELYSDIKKFEDTPIEQTYYVSTQCIYMNPLSSFLSASDSGKTYLIGDSMVAIFDKRDNDAGIFFETLPEWRPLTEEEWAGMFLFQESVVSISHYRNPMILDLSEEYQLVNVDGTLWMVHCYGDSGIWDIYQLAVANQTATIAQWQADLTGDGVDETITVEGVIAEGVSHYVAATIAVTDAAGKGLWNDGFNIGSDEMADFYLIETDGKYSILEWSAMERENVLAYSYSIIELDGTSAGAQYETLRCGLSDEELLAIDLGEVEDYFDNVRAMMEGGTLLLGGTGGEIVYSTPEEPFTSVWRSPVSQLTVMKNLTEQRWSSTARTMAVHTADLTHDGVDETITLSYEEQAMNYLLIVSDVAGNILWTGEANTFHMGYLGYYLYERDGKEYLLEWSTNGWTGTACYYYQVFSLTEEGKEKTLILNDFSYDTNSIEQILFIDISDMRAYEKEANALLANAVVLIDTNDGKVVLGDPANPVTRLWESPADQWEQTQQELIDQLPIVMAYMELDQELLNCIEEQVKLRLGDYELAHVQQVEEIPTAAIGTTGGDFLYRVVYQPGDYEKSTHRVTWDDRQCFYLITHEDWGEMPGEEDDRWYFVGTLSEEELQSNYNTPDMLAQYDNDPYLAAVVETVNQWRNN